MAIVPTEMAARFYNDGAGGIKHKRIPFVIADDQTITKFSNLKGKVVQVVGKNSATDIIFRYLLR